MRLDAKRGDNGLMNMSERYGCYKIVKSLDNGTLHQRFDFTLIYLCVADENRLFLPSMFQFKLDTEYIITI